VQARLAFGILLALGLADLAVLNVKLAPELAALPPEDSPQVKPPVAGEGTLAKTSPPARPPETAPSPTLVAPPPTSTVVAQVSASASPSSGPSASGAPAASTVGVEPPATAVAGKPPDGLPPSSTPGEVIPDIVFGIDATNVSSPSDIANLRAVAQKLVRDPSKRLMIRGHSDQLGSPEHKRALSQRRAITVQKFLVAHGAPVERTSTEAVSDSEPADTRNTPVAWAQNRRVQVLWR
jgi:peptidoglycan-associated lipoprotein